MSRFQRALAIGAGILLLGGCAGVRTGNAVADTAIYGALGAAEAKGEKQKQAQRDFESDLAKLHPK